MLRNLTFGKLKNESGTKAPLIHLAAAFTVWWASTAPGFAVDLADLPTGGAAPQPVVAVACPGGNCPLRPYSVRPAPPVAPNIAPIEVSPPQMSLSPNQRAAVVRIVSNISPRSRGLGSGVLVATEQQLGIIVTARHVVGERDNRLAMDATPEATVWFGDGRSVAAQAVYTDRDGFDLAAVIVELPSNLATAELAPAEVGGLPTPGQWVLACGYGGDGQYREQPNRVIGTGSFERPGDCLELLGTFRGGDSGGPVFDTQSRVVAIINASSQPGAAGQDNLATHCGAIRAFVGRVRARLRSLLAKRRAPESRDNNKPNVDPIAPPAALDQPSADNSGHAKQLADLVASVRDQDRLLQKLRADLADGLHGLGTAQQTDQQDLLGKLDGRLATLRAGLQAALAGVAEKQDVAALGSKLPEIAAALAKLQPLATAAAPAVGLIPGVGPGLSALLVALGGAAAGGGSTWGLLQLFAARRRKATPSTTTGTTNLSDEADRDAMAATLSRILGELGALRTGAAAVGATGNSPNAAGSAPASRTVVLETPPPPQVVERSQQFVPYQAPNVRLDALEQAMAEYVRRYPTAAGIFETINRYADQFESGQKKPAIGERT